MSSFFPAYNYSQVNVNAERKITMMPMGLNERFNQIDVERRAALSNRRTVHITDAPAPVLQPARAKNANVFHRLGSGQRPIERPKPFSRKPFQPADHGRQRFAFSRDHQWDGVQRKNTGSAYKSRQLGSRFGSKTSYNTRHFVPKKKTAEDLDHDLDSYIMKDEELAKSRLNTDLDSYMEMRPPKPERTLESNIPTQKQTDSTPSV